MNELVIIGAWALRQVVPVLLGLAIALVLCTTFFIVFVLCGGFG